MAQNSAFREEKTKETFEHRDPSSSASGAKLNVEIEDTNTGRNVDTPCFQVTAKKKDVQPLMEEDSPSQRPSSTVFSRSPEHKLSGTKVGETTGAVESKLSFPACGSSGTSSNSGGLLTYSENPRDMKVLRLREELKSRNLSPSGLKNALVDRLIKALQEEGYNTTGFATEEENSEHPDEAACMFMSAWRYASFACPDDDDFSPPSSRAAEEDPDAMLDFVPPNGRPSFRDDGSCSKFEHLSEDMYRGEEDRSNSVENDPHSEQQLGGEILNLPSFSSEDDNNLSDVARLNTDHEAGADELKTLPLMSNPPSLCKLPSRSFAAIYSSSTKKIYYISSKDWQVHSLCVQDKCSFRAVRCDSGNLQRPSADASSSPDDGEAFESKCGKRPCPSTAVNREIPELGLEGYSATLQGTKIVIFGGSKKESSHTTFYNTCHVYDTETSIWKKLSVKKGDAVPTPRDFHIACSVGSNEIMILGGRTLSKNIDDGGEFQCLNDANILDTSIWKWRAISPEGYFKPRFGHAAIYNPRHHSVFVHGGMHIMERDDSSGKDEEALDDDSQCTPSLWNESNEKLEELADVIILNLDVMKWTTVDSLYGTGVLPRVHHTACLRNGKIFLYGGCNTIYGSFFIPNDVRYFEIDTLHWHKLVSSKKPCKGRWGHSAFMINEEMIIMGGYLSESESTRTVLVINTEQKPTVVLCEDILMSNLKQLLQSELFADINFRVQNKYLRAHKAIIACRSSQLRDLCNKKKKRGQTVTLESIKYQTFSLFLQLLYYGRAVVDRFSYESLTELLNTYRLVHKARRLRQKRDYLFSLHSVSLDALLVNPMHFDVYLCVEDKYFSAHRSILSARSSWFMSLIQECQSTDSVPVIQLSFLTVQQCHIVLEFIYLGQLASKRIADLVKSNQVLLVCELMRHADTLKLVELKQHCEKAIFDNWLSAKTAANFYEVAIRANSETLKRCCVYALVSKLKNANFKSNLLQYSGSSACELELAVQQETSRQLNHADFY